MLDSLTFTEDYRCFKQGETYQFRPGVNLLVGDQGTGKSSLCGLLVRYGQRDKNLPVEVKAGICNVFSFDFEKDNPRKKGYLENDHDAMMFQFATMSASHGESVNAILKFVIQQKDSAFIYDEPDMALSIRSCLKLVDMLNQSTEKGNQNVLAVHNPIIIGAFDEVLSLEHKQWMTSEDFIASQKTPEKRKKKKKS